MLHSRFRLNCILAMMVLMMGFVIGCEGDESAISASTAMVSVIEATAVPPADQLEETAEQSEDILISELLPGLPGANNSEFIELYNTGPATADLQGWSLWYSLNGDDEKLVYEWTLPAEIPGHGHYLLVHEGMLVWVESAVVIAPTTRFGEYVVVADAWEVSHIARTDPVGYDISVDDGSEVPHEDQSTLPYVVKSGDQVQNLIGVLAFTFGNYKIEPTVMPEIVAGERPLPTLPSLGPGEFSLATFNVENLFDTADPHPTSPPRPASAQYRLKLDKIAQTILAMAAATIIGLQEVENIAILEDLVELETLVGFDYVPYLIEGSDSRGIDNAYLVRSDQATVDGVMAYSAPEALTTRPPLIITVTLHLESGGQTMVLLNNHFTALSAGEEVTEPQRIGQAALNVSAMEQIRATHPDTLFVVMGDLNSFYDTLPIHTLQEAGLRHVYEFLDEPLPYTYIFEGRTQTLDHILLSEGLFGRTTAVTVLHLNADYPPPAPKMRLPNTPRIMIRWLCCFPVNETV